MAQQTKGKGKDKAATAKARAAKVAETVKNGLAQVVSVFKPVGIALEVVNQYAAKGAAEVFQSIGAEFNNVREALTYRSAVAAHLFVAENKARDVEPKEYNKALTAMLEPLMAWRMARAMPDLGFLILRYGLTPEDVRGKIALMAWNASTLKESAGKAEVLAALGKLKVEKVEKGKAARGAQDKNTVPTAATLTANLQRWMDAHKDKTGVTFAQLADAIDEDATASPFNFLVALVLTATGKEDKIETVKAAMVKASA